MTVKTCTHYWLVTTDGPRVFKGKCKLCKATRVFRPQETGFGKGPPIPRRK